MRDERLPVCLEVARVERGEELVGLVDRDQLVDWPSGFSELVVELDVGLSDLHRSQYGW